MVFFEGVLVGLTFPDFASKLCSGSISVLLGEAQSKKGRFPDFEVGISALGSITKRRPNTKGK